MATPLGDFIRARRDGARPDTFGLPDHGRRRSPGLRRMEVATWAGISVEYLTRIEQGRQRNPSPAVIDALGDAFRMDPSERNHIRYLAKITRDECSVDVRPEPPSRQVRAAVLRTLRMLEPGIAIVTNRLGDVLAHTSGFRSATSGTGLLDDARPNLNRFVFTDPRARAFFADWDDVADELIFDMWRAPSIENLEWIIAELTPAAGPEFTERLRRHVTPRRGVLRLRHPDGAEFRLVREHLELPADAQQLVVYHPEDTPSRCSRV